MRQSLSYIVLVLLLIDGFQLSRALQCIGTDNLLEGYAPSCRTNSNLVNFNHTQSCLSVARSSSTATCTAAAQCAEINIRLADGVFGDTRDKIWSFSTCYSTDEKEIQICGGDLPTTTPSPTSRPPVDITADPVHSTTTVAPGSVPSIDPATNPSTITAASITDPSTTTTAALTTDPSTTTTAELTTTDPSTTTTAEPTTDPSTTTIVEPTTTDPSTTTTAEPTTTDPSTTTTAEPTTDPSTTTTAAPTTDPSTTTTAAPTTDPSTTTTAAPTTDPSTTTAAAQQGSTENTNNNTSGTENPNALSSNITTMDPTTTTTMIPTTTAVNGQSQSSNSASPTTLAGSTADAATTTTTAPTTTFPALPLFTGCATGRVSLSNCSDSGQTVQMTVIVDGTTTQVDAMVDIVGCCSTADCRPDDPSGITKTRCNYDDANGNTGPVDCIGACWSYMVVSEDTETLYRGCLESVSLTERGSGYTATTCTEQYQLGVCSEAGSTSNEECVRCCTNDDCNDSVQRTNFLKQEDGNSSEIVRLSLTALMMSLLVKLLL